MRAHWTIVSLLIALFSSFALKAEVITEQPVIQAQHSVSNRIFCSNLLAAASSYLSPAIHEENTERAVKALKKFRGSFQIPDASDSVSYRPVFLDSETANENDLAQLRARIHGILEDAQTKSENNSYTGGFVLRGDQIEQFLENTSIANQNQFLEEHDGKTALWILRPAILAPTAYALFGISGDHGVLHSGFSALIATVFLALTAIVHPEPWKYFNLYSSESQDRFNDLKYSADLPSWLAFSLDVQHDRSIVERKLNRKNNGLDHQRILDGCGDWPFHLADLITTYFQPEWPRSLIPVKIDFLYRKGKDITDDELTIFIRTFRKMPPPGPNIRRELTWLEALRLKRLLGFATVPVRD